MGYKKAATHHRDEISGLHVHDDAALKNGEVSVNQLRALMDSRQAGINAAHKADWPKDMVSSNPEHTDPSLGNAFSRLPKPVDVVIGSKAPRYGASAEDDTNAAVQGGQPQKTAKQKGIEPPKKRA